jgi:BioD-like phosphotransacetylase family protein
MSKTTHVRLFQPLAGPHGNADADDIVEMDNATAKELVDTAQAEEVDIKNLSKKDARKGIKRLIKPSAAKLKQLDEKKRNQKSTLVKVSGDPNDPPVSLNRGDDSDEADEDEDGE